MMSEDQERFPLRCTLPVIGQGLDRLRCDPGQHDYILVDEGDFHLFQRPRLVLYCRTCGDVITHSLETDVKQ